MHSLSGEAHRQIDYIGQQGPQLRCAHNIFELVAATSPTSIALVFGNDTVTYSELDASANRIAKYLLSLGVTSETPVAIAMRRSPELIACILGVLKAGTAYLPLDPDTPTERLATIIETASVRFVLTTAHLSGVGSVLSTKWICIDEVDLSGFGASDPKTVTNPQDLAYVMFTSGSTGQPKGVMVEHRSIVRLVKDTDYADFGPGNVFLQFAPVTFDASTFEIWGALLNGGRLAIMPEGTTSLEELGLAIRDYGVTTLWLTTGLFNLMVDERIDDLKPLRQLLAGGDVLSVAHVQRALENLDCDLINGYGPTENTTFTCTYKIPRNEDLGTSIPIGKPIANTQVIILDEDMNEVPSGDMGELYIGGDGLARGYLKDEAMTAERFIDNPFASIPSRKLYRSGDLARFRPDGNVEFLGRADRQIKIRGFRIELEEVELALTRQAGVRQAVAVAKEQPGTEKRLVAFVVLDRESSLDLSQVQAGMRLALPEYMVPSLILPLDAMPLTTNGKVDRAALISMADQATRGTQRAKAPRDGNERRIAEILQTILGNGAVGTNDNFFDLGASSLQIARFHSRLQVAFDSDIKIVSLFQNPTVSSLARLIGSDEKTNLRAEGLHDRATRQRDSYAHLRQLRNRGVGR